VLLAEEAGYAALPEPFVEHALVGAPLVAGAIAGVVDGSVAVTAGDPLAPYGATADLAVVLAPDPQLVAHGEWSVARSVDGSRRPARVERVVQGRPLARDEVRTAFWRGNLGYAAQLLGLARRMLAMTVGYVAERRQFGVPIGSFQAVKHHLADVRITVEFAAPLVYRAAYSQATGDPDASTHTAMAKAQAADAAALAARASLQCHGAIGYSYEHDLHLFMKRAWALGRTWGDAAWHRDRVAGALLDH
jgi:hypothetical protein